MLTISPILRMRFKNSTGRFGALALSKPKSRHLAFSDLVWPRKVRLAYTIYVDVLAFFISIRD